MDEQTRTVTYCRIEVAAERVGMPPSRVRRYVRAGLVPAARVERGAPLLDDAALGRLRRIRRLSDDLGINSAGVEVVLRLLDQIEALQAALDRSEPRP